MNITVKAKVTITVNHDPNTTAISEHEYEYLLAKDDDKQILQFWALVEWIKDRLKDTLNKARDAQ